MRSVERIVAGLKRRAWMPPLVVTGALDDDYFTVARQKPGLTLAAGLEAGIF